MSPRQSASLTDLGETVLAFGNNPATQNAGWAASVSQKISKLTPMPFDGMLCDEWRRNDV